MDNILKLISSSASFLWIKKFLTGNSFKELNTESIDEKSILEFLQYTFSMLWKLWSSTDWIVLISICPAYLVWPKVPSFLYLPALPAIWPISDGVKFLLYFPSNFWKDEKDTWLMLRFNPIAVASVATK